jgi:hypothetical protein
MVYPSICGTASLLFRLLLTVFVSIMSQHDVFSRTSQFTYGTSFIIHLLGEYYDPTGRSPFLRAYVNFMNKHCHTRTYNTVRVQEEGSTLCGHHCMFYLIQRCAGNNMADFTKLPQGPKVRLIIWVICFWHRPP